MGHGLDDIRRERDLRRLSIAIHDADRHATGNDSVMLLELKQMARRGEVDILDAIATVNHLREQQHQNRTAA